MSINEEQIANWRSGMAILTAYFDSDDDQRANLTRQMLLDAYAERGIGGVIGATFGLQGIAALTTTLLATATGRSTADTLQIIGREFEKLLPNDQG